jgi:acetoin utilization deacetylase AcuC-like enzyme
VLALISHPACHDHDAGSLHPDTAQRLDAINNQLIASGLDFVLRRYDAPPVTREQLERVHDADYLDRVAALAPSEGFVEIDGDTVMSPGTLDAARHAAGAGVMGVDLIMRGEANPVFCAVRPPGHHAVRAQAMGFCLYNNIAVAAAHAMAEYGLNRVAIVDFDVHHGNGTEDIFAQDSRVLFCSSFQHPFYPFTGHVPLSRDSDGAQFRAAVAEHWFPALETFRPEMLFISAGFDAHVLDDMSDLRLTEADYEWLTQELLGIARRHAGGRVLSMLEGGYEPAALARSVIRHLKVLMD